MDINDLFVSCRKGDLSRVQYLIEQKEVELNVRDKWDSTPLYYACLCGHDDVVRFLLQHGAKCEANTFDGERCIYGALTSEIRNILKSYKTLTATTAKRDLFNECMRKLFERGQYSDITFDVQGVFFNLHRCVLIARSDYFANMFATKWAGKTTVTLSNTLVFPSAFKLIIQYLYTGEMQCHIDHIENVIMLAKQCHVWDLRDKIAEKLRGVLSLESTKPGVHVNMITLESCLITSELRDDLEVLASNALPTELWAETLFPFPPEQPEMYTDVILRVEERNFQCHKAFLCGRSDYFTIAIEDNFGETSVNEENKQVVTLQGLKATIFAKILYYIYSDRCELNESCVWDVLQAADLYLLPGLKRQCATVIGKLVDAENCIFVLSSARLFNLPRLEDVCSAFIANNIEKVLQQDDFISLVKADAASVHGREETDSIPVIDDVRFHITNYVQTFSDMYDAEKKLAAIDLFLESLNLDA